MVHQRLTQKFHILAGLRRERQLESGRCTHSKSLARHHHFRLRPCQLSCSAGRFSPLSEHLPTSPRTRDDSGFLGDRVCLNPAVLGLPVPHIKMYKYSRLSPVGPLSIILFLVSAASPTISRNELCIPLPSCSFSPP